MAHHQYFLVILAIVAPIITAQRCDGTCFRFALEDTPSNRQLCPYEKPHVEFFYGQAEPLDVSFSQVALCAGTVRCLPVALLNSSWAAKRMDGHDTFDFDSTPLFDTDIVLGSCEKPGSFVSTALTKGFGDFFNATYGAMLAQNVSIMLIYLLLE
jgi:hypothetical protein